MSKARTTRPIFTIAGIVFPAICVAMAFILSTSSPNSGGWGLGEIFLFVVLILAGAVLGAVLNLVALKRGEPGRPLQVIVLLVGVGVAVFFGRPFLRARPATPMPTGESAFLLLAPAPARVGPQSIVLAYPADNSAANPNGFVTCQRDSLGVVTSLRTADVTVAQKSGELLLQLEAIDGRWTVRRNGDFIRKLSDRKWRRATYLEVRKNQMGWGVPVGIADEERRPLD
jgi:hypothetical protein